MNTKDKGDLAELKILTKLVELGYSVSIPYGENQGYDLILDNRDGDLLKVQVKHGRYDKGRIIFSTVSQYKVAGENIKKGYNVDLFGVYCSYNDKCYLINYDIIKDLKSTCNLRITPQQNGNQNDVRWAKDYEL